MISVMEMLIEKADSHTVTVAKHQLDDQDNDPRHIFKTNSLCYKEWKKEKKKLRRKLRRQQLAKQEAKVESSSPSEETVDSEDERQKSLKQHELWLLKEKEAQAAWRAKQSYYRHLKEQKQLQENKIREEWEAKQAAEREEEEKKRIEEAEAKRQQVKLYTDLRIVELETTLVIQFLDYLAAVSDEKLEELLNGQKTPTSEQTHNPEPPSSNNLPEPQNICSFFRKVGACRFGDRCSRVHTKPAISKTLLVSGMYNHPSLDNLYCGYDTDISLEYDEEDFYQHFKEFYYDTLPEFDAVGHVVQFKVCCNYEQHLRGNVYVQYTSENEAFNAFKLFNGRWYGGRQLQCSFTTVEKWKPAICGQFRHKKCPKGRNCNFLHVFNNPDRRFSLADRDIISANERSDEHYPTKRDSSRRSRRSDSSHVWSPSSRRHCGSSPSSRRSEGSSRRSDRLSDRESSSKRESKRSRRRSTNGWSSDEEDDRSRRDSCRRRKSSRDDHRDHSSRSHSRHTSPPPHHDEKYKLKSEKKRKHKKHKDRDDDKRKKNSKISSRIDDTTPVTKASVMADTEDIDWRYCRTPSDDGGSSPDLGLNMKSQCENVVLW